MPSGLEYDGDGVLVCARCRGKAHAAKVEEERLRSGGIRRCPKCREDTMYGGDVVDVVRVAGETETRWRLKFDCPRCGHRVTLLPLPVLVLFALVAAGVAVRAITADETVLPLVLLLAAVLVTLVYQLVQRVRHRVRKA